MGSANTTPFILASDATYTCTAGVPTSAFTPFALSNFVNRLSVPVEITELNFTASCVNSGVVVSLDRRFASGVEIDLRVGRFGITNGFTPLGALGIRYDTAAFESGVAVSPVGVVTVGTRWILPKPLILGPRESFAGSVRASPNVPLDAVNSTVTVTAVARGRRYDGPMPRTRLVPYASGAFYTQAFPANPPFQPPTRTFGNIFRVPLHVKSINGFRASSTDSLNLSGSNLRIVGPGGLSQTVRRTWSDTPRMDASMNARLAIEESTVLLPDEFYQINLSGFTLVAAPSAIVMVGYREEN